ncbi:MAG: FtsQ-type POTRA domain-containing protein [Alphaproteobacteria bacterium]|nr:FtsQ-type POTRA domain-containing protein [Alphaproteobacteria bacterium]
MRFLSRRAAAPPRRRPFPIAATAVSVGVVLASASAAGGYWLWRDGVVIRTASAIDARLLAIGDRHGLALENVDVVGRRRQSVASILQALGVQRGMPMFDIDLATARRRLEMLPWIRSADVERQLPDTLFVRLTEREPFAFWQRGDTLSLIDRDGTVIQTDNVAQYGPRLVLVGDDAPAQAAGLVDMLATEPALARRVTAAVRFGDHRWTLHFDTGVEAALPETGAPAAWQRLASLEGRDHILERNIVAVDLRLPDRLIVRLAPTDAAKRAGSRVGNKGRSS